MRFQEIVEVERGTTRCGEQHDLRFPIGSKRGVLWWSNRNGKMSLQSRRRREDFLRRFHKFVPHHQQVRYVSCNLVPRFSLLPVKRPWLGLVKCLPESGRLQTNDLGEGRINVRFVFTKLRRRDQLKLCIRPCLKGPVFYSSRTSQDKTSNAESFDSESVTSCRISGCLSDVAKEIRDSPVVQSKKF